MGNVRRKLEMALLLFVIGLTTSAFLFAQDQAAQVASIPGVPDWIVPILKYLESLPKVGPIITFAIEVVATLGTVFTMLTVCLTGVCKTLSTISQFANLGPLADKIQAFHDKVWPYFAYLSIFNVKEKPAPLLAPKV